MPQAHRATPGIFCLHIFRLRAASTALLLGALTPAVAQQDAPAPPLTGIAEVALRVKDLAASIAFYQKLGFEKAFELEPQNTSSAVTPDPSSKTTAQPASVKTVVLKVNDRQFLQLSPINEKEPAARLLHLCFQSFDLEALAEDYQSRGLTHTTIAPDAAGDLRFTVAGPLAPTGPQQVDFVEYQPGSLPTSDLGQHLGADRVAEKLIAVALPVEDPDAARDFYLNQLNFKPIAGEPMDLHLPGTSGQEIDILPADLGSHIQITFDSSNLGRAARHLHKQGLAVEKSGGTLTLTDPDGNVVLLETR